MRWLMMSYLKWTYTVCKFNYHFKLFLKVLKSLFLKAPNKNCNRWHFHVLLLSFEENKAWFFRWILCLADLWLSSATVVIGALIQKTAIPENLTNSDKPDDDTRKIKSKLRFCMSQARQKHQQQYLRFYGKKFLFHLTTQLKIVTML